MRHASRLWIWMVLVAAVALPLGLWAEHARRQLVREQLSGPIVAAAERGDLAALGALLDRGAGVDSVDNGRFPWTPLMHAAFRGDPAMVDDLLNRGADPNREDLDAFTAITLAAGEGHWLIVETLAEQGADPLHTDATGQSALSLARAGGTPDLADRLEMFARSGTIGDGRKRPMGDGWQRAWQALRGEFGDLNDVGPIVRVCLRLIVAAVLGGLLGFERERKGKDAGLRTHMLVAIGSALFVLVPQQAGATEADVTRIIQGLVAGIGFLGAGAIVKSKDGEEVRGLTTAAGIWLTAAVGMAAGLGRESTAILCTLLALAILSIGLRIERWIPGSTNRDDSSGRRTR